MCRIHIVTADVVFLPHHKRCVTGVVREQEEERVWTCSFDCSIACWVGEDMEGERKEIEEEREERTEELFVQSSLSSSSSFSSSSPSSSSSSSSSLISKQKSMGVSDDAISLVESYIPQQQPLAATTSSLSSVLKENGAPDNLKSILLSEYTIQRCTPTANNETTPSLSSVLKEKGVSEEVNSVLFRENITLAELYAGDYTEMKLREMGIVKFGDLNKLMKLKQ